MVLFPSCYQEAGSLRLTGTGGREQRLDTGSCCRHRRPAFANNSQLSNVLRLEVRDLGGPVWAVLCGEQGRII